MNEKTEDGEFLEGAVKTVKTVKATVTGDPEIVGISMAIIAVTSLVTGAVVGALLGFPAGSAIAHYRVSRRYTKGWAIAGANAVTAKDGTEALEVMFRNGSAQILKKL